MTTLIGENSGWSKRARGSTRPAFSPSRALADVFALQRDRWILWLPPAMIAGAAAWLLAPADPPVWTGPVFLTLGAAATFALSAWPSPTPLAAIAAILAPFGLADPAIELMASALDLIAAVGQTFGERPEAVRAVPRPPDIAFILCVFALLWACLWRGALRWIGAPIFAASVAIYVGAPLPVAAFDADLRAIYIRDNGRWTLLAAGGRSTYARDRLGATLGLSPSEIERLAPPETCGDSLCQWSTSRRSIFLARDVAALDRACVSNAVVIANAETPPGYASRCQLAALIDSQSIAHLGGATITETSLGPRIARAWPPEIRRAWTPQAPSADQE